MAKTTIVRRPDFSLRGQTLDAPIVQTGAIARDPPTPRSDLAPLARLEAERGILGEIPLPNRVITIIQAACRPVTTRIYESTWTTFFVWCCTAKVGLMNALVKHVLIFLQHGFDKGRAPNSLRRQVAALASILSCGAPDPITRHPLIRTFLRGVTNL